MPGSVDYEVLLNELGSQQFSKLRPAQEETLRLYGLQFTDKKDIAIELPTGAGKSLIALLIAEVWRREGKAVAILTGNKTLARQMEHEANTLGIKAIRMEGPGASIPAADKRSYHRARAVAIMNYWVYINQNPVIDPAHLLIMDDAHLAEHCLHSLYSVEISRFTHKALFDALASELAARFPEYSILQDALDSNAPPTASAELLSFLDQSLVKDRIREIIDASPALEADPDLRFRWRRLRDRVEEANIYLSDRLLWFRPGVYPLLSNSYYNTPMQCIYMSATIGETSDLARRLGTRPIAKLPIPKELSALTYGRRMVVMNRIEDKDIPARLSHVILTALKIHSKSVWLCSSLADAERFRDVVTEWLNLNGLVGHPTWILSSLGDEIDEFKKAAIGHLFVAGRFDGMDFKADECRLVVLATLPKAINIQEEFFTAHLRDAGFMLKRANQRIVQALGRCNRAPDDFGVYVLADRRFATHFGRESNRLGLPRNLIAEIDSAEDATDLDISDLIKGVSAFLLGNFEDFDRDLEEHLEDLPEQDVASGVERAPSSEDEVVGWTEMFERQNYPAAKLHFKKCSEETSNTKLRELGAFFQWLEAKAAFLSGNQGHSSTQIEALDLLYRAIERGGQSAWFNRLRTSFNRHSSSPSHQTTTSPIEYAHRVVAIFNERLERLGEKGPAFQRWGERTKDMLTSMSHAQYQEGLEELGKILGYSAVRPKYGAATDCRWRGIFGNVRELVTFEAKIEHAESGKIVPSDVGQAHIQLARAKKEYNHLGYIIRGTIVTHLADVDHSARSSLDELRIIEKQAILSLWERVFIIFSQYRDAWSAEDSEARIIAEEAVIPKLPPAGWLTRSIAKDEPFVSQTDLLTEWP